MGTQEGYKGGSEPGTFSEDYRRIMERSDTPLDGGWGLELEVIPRAVAIARAEKEAREGVVVPEGGSVETISTVPYAGGEPLVRAVVRHPVNSHMERLPA